MVDGKLRSAGRGSATRLDRFPRQHCILCVAEDENRPGCRMGAPFPTELELCCAGCVLATCSRCRGQGGVATPSNRIDGIRGRGRRPVDLPATARNDARTGGKCLSTQAGDCRVQVQNRPGLYPPLPHVSHLPTHTLLPQMEGQTLNRIHLAAAVTALEEGGRGGVAGHSWSLLPHTPAAASLPSTSQPCHPSLELRPSTPGEPPAKPTGGSPATAALH